MVKLAPVDDRQKFDFFYFKEIAPQELFSYHSLCEGGHINSLEWQKRNFKFAWALGSASILPEVNQGHTPNI